MLWEYCWSCNYSRISRSVHIYQAAPLFLQFSSAAGVRIANLCAWQHQQSVSEAPGQFPLTSTTLVMSCHVPDRVPSHQNLRNHPWASEIIFSFPLWLEKLMFSRGGKYTEDWTTLGTGDPSTMVQAPHLAKNKDSWSHFVTGTYSFHPCPLLPQYKEFYAGTCGYSCVHLCSAYSTHHFCAYKRKYVISFFLWFKQVG